MAVQIENERLSAARDINAAAIVVGIDIVNAAGSHDLNSIEHSVRFGG